MKLEGLIAATYTPFHPDGSINREMIPAMVDHMIDRGVSGFYVNGSTGEGESLSTEERMEVAGAFVEATQRRVPVIIQVGHNSIEVARALARHAVLIGATGISSLPPTYFKPPSLEGLVDSIEAITSVAPGLPYYYYHIPRMTGVSPDMSGLLAAARERIPTFAGIKFSDFYLADMVACQEFDQGRYDIVFGSDEMILGALAMGATGAVGSCYGFAAPLWQNIIDAHVAGDRELAQAWMGKAARLVRLIDREPGPFQAVVKQVIWSLLGFETGSLRLPQPSLSGEALSRAKESLDNSGFAEEMRSGVYQLS